MNRLKNLICVVLICILLDSKAGLMSGTFMAMLFISGAFATLRSAFSKDKVSPDYKRNREIVDLVMRSVDKNINTPDEELYEELYQYG